MTKAEHEVKAKRRKYKLIIIAKIIQMYELKNVSIYNQVLDELLKTSYSKIYFLNIEINSELIVLNMTDSIYAVDDYDNLINLGYAHSTGTIIDKKIKKIIYFDSDCNNLNIRKINQSIKLVDRSYVYIKILRYSFQDEGLEYQDDYQFNCNLLALLYILYSCIKPNMKYNKIIEYFEKTSKDNVLDWCYNLITFFNQLNPQINLNSIIYID